MLAVDTCTPSKLADVLMLFNYIQEVPSSNFGWDTDYPDGVFMVFLSPSSQRPEQYLKLGHAYFQYPFQFIIHCHSII
jgi:hypothetical protein